MTVVHPPPFGARQLHQQEHSVPFRQLVIDGFEVCARATVAAAIPGFLALRALVMDLSPASFAAGPSKAPSNGRCVGAHHCNRWENKSEKELIMRRFRPSERGLGAGSGNRTRIASLEGWSFTTKLYPRAWRRCGVVWRTCHWMQGASIFPLRIRDRLLQRGAPIAATASASADHARSQRAAGR